MRRTRTVESLFGLLALAIGIAVACLCGTAHAAVLWTNPSGSTTNYDYSEGNTDNQLFVPAGNVNQPIATPNGIVFFPTNFKAASSNGNANQISDTLRFKLTVKPGKNLVGFAVEERGDYSIQGSGGAHTGVKAYGELLLVNLVTGAVLTSTLTAVPPTPVALTQGIGITSGQGEWIAQQTIVPIPAGWTQVQVILNNILQTSTDANTNAFIEKKFVGPPVEFSFIIPEPASIGLLVGAAMLLMRRRAASI